MLFQIPAVAIKMNWTVLHAVMISTEIVVVISCQATILSAAAFMYLSRVKFTRFSYLTVVLCMSMLKIHK